MARAEALETSGTTRTTGTTGDTRELIVRAALQAFSEQGFDGATTREIATRAGVNHGLIPYYFGGKPKLWRAAVDLAFAELGQALGSVLDEPAVADGRARAGLLIRGYVHFVARNPEFVRLMHEEGKRKGPRMRWLVDRHVKPMYDAVSAMLERGDAPQFLPPGLSPIHFHYILAGSVGLIFHQAEECKRLSGIDPFEESVIEDHARAVEYLLLGPAKGEDSE